MYRLKAIYYENYDVLRQAVQHCVHFGADVRTQPSRVQLQSKFPPSLALSQGRKRGSQLLIVLCVKFRSFLRHALPAKKDLMCLTFGALHR